MSWHTQYRPQAVAQLHQKEVRELLLQLMKSGKFPQVFLCAGPKGTGKTSTARIIGAMLNDPANQLGKPLTDPTPDSDLAQAIFTGNSFVVQELDAASNRGIDDIRQLKERVSVPPGEARYGVYILDEVHMLTTEAFNALLKLLEEPPAHAVFVLATTELHKVPATIQSRATILPFRLATQQEIIEALEKVVKAEKLTVDEEALTQIATLADGSFRDAIKSLEMVASAATGASITTELVEATLHVQFSSKVPDLLIAVTKKQPNEVVTIMSELRAQGVNTSAVHKAVVSFLHQDMLKSMGVLDGDAVFTQRVSHFLLTELQDLPLASLEPLPLLALELKLLDLIFRSQDKASGGGSTTSTSNTTTTTKASVSSPKTSAVKATTPEATTPEATIPEDSSIDFAVQNVVVPEHIDTRPLLEAWAGFVQSVEKRNATLAAFLRSAKPLTNQSNGTAKIEVYYAFHRDQLMQPKFMTLLQECAATMIGGNPGFEFVLADRKVSPEQGTADMEAAVADSLLM